VSGAAEPTTAGLAEQARFARAGKASAVELVTAALERARAAQQSLNAFRVIRDEDALTEAEEADRRLAADEGGPLLGVPVASRTTST
jgi:amidase